jgi:hypothetical protein
MAAMHTLIDGDERLGASLAPATPYRSATPAFALRGLLAERDAHARQRELVRASLLLRPAPSRGSRLSGARDR